MVTKFVVNYKYKYDLYHAPFVIYMMTHLFFILEHIRKKWIIDPPSQLTHKSKNIDFIKQQRATSSTTDNEDSSNSILSLKSIDTNK